MIRSSSSSRDSDSARSAVRVALLEPLPADLRQAAVRRAVVGARVAVAQVAGEVELEPLRQPARLVHRLRVLGEALGQGLRPGPARARCCRAAAAPTRRACDRAARPRTRPAAGCASERERGRCRWPRTAPPAARRARSAGGCGAGRAGRTGAAARPESARARRRAEAAAPARPPRRARAARPGRRARRRARSRRGRRAPRRGARRHRARPTAAAARAGRSRVPSCARVIRRQRLR